MTKTLFTPGPWVTKKAKGGSGDVGILAESSTCVLAECFADIRREGEQSLAECEANAHLIAASPDGYALAETVVEFFSDLRNGKPISTDRMNEIWTQAEACLCKARGHQHEGQP